MIGDTNPGFSFSNALAKFLIEINGLADCFPIVMNSLAEARKDANSNIGAFLEANGELIETFKPEGKTSIEKIEGYRIAPEYAYEIGRYHKKKVNFTAAASITSKGFIVTAVSQFDAFLGRLIKAIYYSKPDLLNSSDKKLSFTSLINFESIESAREYVLEKEIESVLRESHSEHFKWLENKVGIPLKKGLDIWPDFIEMTERRNLFVHTDGVISSQYIDICRSHGVEIDDKSIIGQKIGVKSSYFQQSCEILFELATKLTHVVWRKLEPLELNEADDNLNSICYDLLKEEKYELAKKILDFALSLPRHSSQENKLMFIINSAIAHKWGGEPDKAFQIIKANDWSACNNAFQLAISVLLEDFDTASNLMKRIGISEKVSKAHYKDWPVFKDFRHTPQFEEAYKEVFGELLETVRVAEEKEIDDAQELSTFLVEGSNSEPFGNI